MWPGLPSEARHERRRFAGPGRLPASPRLVEGTADVVPGIVIPVTLYHPASSHYYDEPTRYEAAMTARGYR